MARRKYADALTDKQDAIIERRDALLAEYTRLRSAVWTDGQLDREQLDEYGAQADELWVEIQRLTHEIEAFPSPITRAQQAFVDAVID